MGEKGRSVELRARLACPRLLYADPVRNYRDAARTDREAY